MTRLRVHLTRVGEGRQRIAFCGAKAMPYPNELERAAGWECGTSRRSYANCKACLAQPTPKA